MRRDQIAPQLYTVRDLAKADLPGTLRKVAEVGYPAVEFAGLHGHAATEIRAVLDEVGMRASSAHVPIARLREDAAAVFEELNTLGAGYAVVPWVEREEQSGDGARRLAADLNELGERAKAAGLTIGYHNHDVEFRPLEGVPGAATLWDLLVAETDPTLVALELDVYWVEYGGGDAAALIREHPERYPLLHLKDMAGEGDALADAPIGQGTLDLGAIARAVEVTTHWYVVEQDNPTDPLADVATSLAGMERLSAAPTPSLPPPSST